MDDAIVPAERLIYLSSAARRLADLVAAAETPVRYEALRHLLRVSEETMTEVLDETVASRLVARGDDAFTYVAASVATGTAIREAMDPERRSRLRAQIASASQRVFE
ncbi:MAG TPA: hypothetical protein VEZ14_13905 [Dehalococcoidia bacterium]|nr:hypothetical protein [Dehalococcoidia bacterium]